MPKRTKPIPHADSPKVVADSDEFRAEAPNPEAAGVTRCPVDGSVSHHGQRCKTCGTVTK